jgi:hypothetical protein
MATTKQNAKYRELAREWDSRRSILAIHAGALEQDDTPENREAVDDATVLVEWANVTLEEHVAEFGLPPVKER